MEIESERGRMWKVCLENKILRMVRTSETVSNAMVQKISDYSFQVAR